MPRSKNIVVDSVHGDIHLEPEERSIIDTSTFQRLRHIKQLSMGHLTYPNATHSRFAHSLGVLKIMSRVVDTARENSIPLTDEQESNMRLAALLHDIGHYPYSHLMEKVDKVLLTEDLIGSGHEVDASHTPYPSHEELGELIITQQDDIRDLIGSEERAQKIANIFRRTEVADTQLTKLIHSSMDMDRFDYLLRDSKAAGVPYGTIDLNYLLNSLRISPQGMLGIDVKALPAAEHFLLARYFMYRTVYYHKTTFGFELACRQLLRRIRNRGQYDVPNKERYGFPKDGEEINDLVTSDQLRHFDDSFVDRVIRDAASDDEEVVAALANTILERRPPKLLKEIALFLEKDHADDKRKWFIERCKNEIPKMAKRMKIKPGMFLYDATRPMRMEERSHLITEDVARDLPPEETDEMIKIFVKGKEEPISIVSVDSSILRQLSSPIFQLIRLYVVRHPTLSEEEMETLAREVGDWEKH